METVSDNDNFLFQRCWFYRLRPIMEALSTIEIIVQVVPVVSHVLWSHCGINVHRNSQFDAFEAEGNVLSILSLTVGLLQEFKPPEIASVFGLLLPCRLQSIEFRIGQPELFLFVLAVDVVLAHSL